MKVLKIACVLLSCLLPLTVLGKGVYMTPETFLAESFSSSPPQIESLWLRDEIRDAAKQILNHNYPGMRIRYWNNFLRLCLGVSFGITSPLNMGV